VVDQLFLLESLTEEAHCSPTGSWEYSNAEDRQTKIPVVLVQVHRVADHVVRVGKSAITLRGSSYVQCSIISIFESIAFIDDLGLLRIDSGQGDTAFIKLRR
jgi:hypothetical protein